MKIAYFAPIAFSDLKQRPQYLAEGLSKTHEVYYIEPTVRILSYVKNKTSFRSKIYKENEKLTVFRCDGKYVLPFRWNAYAIGYINGIYEYIQLKKILKNIDVIVVGFEGWFDVIRRFKTPKLVYDKMDDNVLLSDVLQNRKYLKKCEDRLLKRCVAMFASADIFVERYGKILPVTLIQNAYAKDNYENIIENRKRNSQTVFGYIGVIADWFDNHAIEILAQNPNNQIVLVGPCRIEKIKRKNVHYVGKVRKEKVADYIRSFDVCLYPFQKSDLLDTINPVKIYEYLAFNKPVIAVGSNELRKFEANIYIYESYGELEKFSKQNLDQPFSEQSDYEKFMKDNSWKNRVDKLNKVLEEIV